MPVWEYGDVVEVVKVYRSKSKGYKDLKVGQRGEVRMVGNPSIEPQNQHIYVEFDFNYGRMMLGLFMHQIKKVGE